MNLIWSDQAWEDYLYHHKTDKENFKKINSLVNEIKRTPFKGSGKPEPLKHEYSGYWSRRTNLVDRVVYKVEKDSVFILQCRKHY